MNDTFSRKGAGLEARDEWSRACAEYREQFDALAFPGGYESGLRKIAAGDVQAIEHAIAFLEVRPYFPKSQYMRTKLSRLLKRAALTARQQDRVRSALDRPLKTRTARRAL